MYYSQRANACFFVLDINMGLGMGVGMPMGMPMGMPGGLPSVGSYTDGMEPTKKLKNEETMNLIGEEAWLSLHPV